MGRLGTGLFILWLGSKGTWNHDDSTLKTVLTKVVLSSLVTVGPLACWCVLAAEEKSNGSANDDHTRNDKRHPPSSVLGHVLVLDEGVVDGRHQEVGDSTTSITKTSSERVGSTNNFLVKETSSPYLARYEATTENTNEETDRVKTGRVLDGTCEEGRDGTDNETSSKGPSWSKAITSWTSDKTNEKSSSESNNVGVGNLDLGDLWMKLTSDDICEEWWKGIPFGR